LQPFRKFFHIKAQLFVYMIQHRRIAKTLGSFLVLIISFSFSNRSFSQPNGQALFSANCASCHAVHKDLTGPALAGVEERWGDKKRLYAWIRNNQAFLKTGDKYANELYLKWNKTPMNLFPNLTDPEIDAMLSYIKSVPAPGADTGGGAAGATAEGGDNTLLYGILTLVLAVVALNTYYR
jgi:cytochrome c2